MSQIEPSDVDLTSAQFYRGSILYFISDPEQNGDQSYRFHEDGVLIVDQGKVLSVVDWAALNNRHLIQEVVDYSGQLILPGFIDTHTHYPQVDAIASHGEQLLDWLNKYIYPCESRFSDPVFAEQAAEFFLNQLLRVGTTTAQVFATVHPESVHAFFSKAKAKGMRMICGKVMMDRNAPKSLLDTADQSYQECEELINKWHGVDRLSYAVTPRFAVTSTEAQLAVAGKLLREHPSVYFQTHLAENKEEVKQISVQFPKARDYLDVYEQHGLLGSRSTFAHAIHLRERELQALSSSASHVSFCPSSNLFLGSGLLAVEKLKRHSVSFGLATDVGAGTSFSLLQTLLAAYQVCHLRGEVLSPLQGFYTVTLGNARTLGLENEIGSFNPGSVADFIVLNTDSTPILKHRAQQAQSLEELLFALMVLGDDRTVSAAYIAGNKLYQS